MTTSVFPAGATGVIGTTRTSAGKGKLKAQGGDRDAPKRAVVAAAPDVAIHQFADLSSGLDSQPPEVGSKRAGAYNIAAPGGTAPIDNLELDRVGSMTLADQIARHIEVAISEGALPPAGRLPSWRDLAAQLGVARGTVKAAYEKLIDRQLLVTAGSAGTRVANPLPPSIAPITTSDTEQLLPPDALYRSCDPLVFQMGVPAHDAFPGTLWGRLNRQALHATALRTGHSDSRGTIELRSALASHVAIVRGIECSPDQIIVTGGFRAGLAIALQAISAKGKEAWVEDPSYPATRNALELSGVRPVGVPVDDQGLVVARGRKLSPRAAFAVVTPGQQAPTAVTLSPQRRTALLRWAMEADAWIIEDDYLAELHLSGRSANALASGAGADRVVHIGTFSKTISPMVGIGFLVAPMPLARQLLDVATWLGAPPNAAVQHALAEFLREGHYLRHLRRMRRLYSERRRCLLETLATLGIDTGVPAALSVILPLPDEFDDLALTKKAWAVGIKPAPLSPWFADAKRARSGLMLGVANVLERRAEHDCRQLLGMIGDLSKTVGQSSTPFIPA